jgi:acetyl/propionyl-CoA carboxylase alpha subunit
MAAHGDVVHVYERECSVQRRHQKVIEESPSPAIDAALRNRITEAGARAARAAAYRNAGTIEFLVDLSSGQASAAPFYFLEMNTRLQVEHPVTEVTAGVDLVRAQLLVASGERLPWRQEEISPRGHAIEARVYAEDPERGFIPQAGRITEYREPKMRGLRIDSGVRQRSDVPVHYDPLLAKVIASAETRDLAIARLSAALDQFVIEGITTNIPFVRRILDHPAFRAGTVDTGFLDREGAALSSSAASRAGSGFSRTSATDGTSSWWDPWSGETKDRPVSASGSPRPARRRSSTDGSQSLAAPMPATVVKVLVKPGDRVAKGDTVVVLEAMKMELPLRAGGDATIKAVHCREGELVQPDAVLVEMA